MKLLFLLGLCALTPGGWAAIADVKIALSSTSDVETSGAFVWAQAFARSLEEDGWTATIYPNSTLGSEIVRTEQVKLGLLEINVTGGQEIASFSDLYRALELPFQVPDDNALKGLLTDTTFLHELNRHTVPQGLRVVDFVFLGGMSGLFTARHPVRRIEDLALLRMRAMTSEQIEFFEAWGGPATQVAWEEVPQALQTGIADGYMNPPIVAVLFGHGPQLDYFTNLRFQPSMRTGVISETWYSSLDEYQRTSVEHALKQARQANHKWLERAGVHEFSMLRDIGIEIIEVEAQERARFRQRLQPAYREIAGQAALDRLAAYLAELK